MRSLLDRCPAGAVHVATDLRYQSLFFSGFSKLTGASPSLLVDARLQSTPIISPGHVSCPVLGWAESIWKEILINRAPDADLLKLLKIGLHLTRSTSAATAPACGSDLLPFDTGLTWLALIRDRTPAQAAQHSRALGDPSPRGQGPFPRRSSLRLWHASVSLATSAASSAHGLQSHLRMRGAWPGEPQLSNRLCCRFVTQLLAIRSLLDCYVIGT